MAKRPGKAVEPKEPRKLNENGRGKYTRARVDRIIYAIQKGATHALAMKYAGIDDNTFYRWIQKYPEFADAIDEAEGVAAVGWLDKIETAATEGTWQAAAWKLERRYPHQYGRTVTEVTGKDSGPVQVEITDARAKLAELIARRNEAKDDA